MKRIIVYADFDFLATPQEIGILGYEHVRGNDHFVFEYSREWLKQFGGILLSGDLLSVPSLQHPRGNDNVFAGWHSTSCLATPMIISVITASCLPRKDGHYHLHTISIQEQRHINACLSTHTRKSQTSTSCSLQARATCLKGRMLLKS